MSLPHTLHIGRPDGVINWRMPLRLLLVNLSLLALCLAMAVAALCYGTLQLSLEQVFADRFRSDRGDDGLCRRPYFRRAL